MVERWLSNSMEQHQFHWQCRCGHEHYRWCTPNNLRKAADLLCLYCHGNSAAWKKGRKFRVAECEQAFAQCVKALGLDSEVTWQVLLPGWDGCLDFVHLPSMTIFQVDGCSHFIAQPANTARNVLLTDIECCKWAMQHKRRLVRMHHKHKNIMQIINAALQLPHEAFVLLTIEYHNVQVCTHNHRMTYVDKVAEQVAPAQRCAVHDMSYILFL